MKKIPKILLFLVPSLGVVLFLIGVNPVAIFKWSSGTFQYQYYLISFVELAAIFSFVYFSVLKNYPEPQRIFKKGIILATILTILGIFVFKILTLFIAHGA